MAAAATAAGAWYCMTTTIAIIKCVLVLGNYKSNNSRSALQQMQMSIEKQEKNTTSLFNKRPRGGGWTLAAASKVVVGKQLCIAHRQILGCIIA